MISSPTPVPLELDGVMATASAMAVEQAVAFFIIKQVKARS
jgi:hypothetical protein